MPNSEVVAECGSSPSAILRPKRNQFRKHHRNEYMDKCVCVERGAPEELVMYLFRWSDERRRSDGSFGRVMVELQHLLNYKINGISFGCNVHIFLPLLTCLSFIVWLLCDFCRRRRLRCIAAESKTQCCAMQSINSIKRTFRATIMCWNINFEEDFRSKYRGVTSISQSNSSRGREEWQGMLQN